MSERKVAEISMTENKSLESALEKVKAQKINLGFLERFDVDENWEVTKALEEIQQYRAIGTVSEFRELKETATAKKPKMIVRYGCTTHECPNCGQLLHDDQNFCHDCGTELDWSDEE